VVSGELFATAYNFLTFSLSHLFSFFRNFACANQRERMIVGYDAKRIVRNGTGLGSYSRTLVNNLAETAADSLELRLYAPDAGRDDLRCQIVQRPNIKWCYPKLKPQTSKLKALYWRSWGIVKDLVRDGVQVYHGLSGELPTGLRKEGIRSVVTIHDLIFMRHPEYYSWIDAKLYEWKFRRTVREADHIIAISECTKRDIMELGHVPEEKISVIYQSYAPRFSQLLCPPRGTKGGLYILSVGTIEERKNALLAVQALHYLPENLSLVLVGRATDYARKVRQYADSHGLGERVVMLHNVTNEQLPQLYADAEAFVYPSRYEGFGIPIIEAIAMGLPVVAATGSCLEEAGGPHSLYVGPDDAEALAAAVSQVLRGAPGREERIAASRDYIRRFEGQDVARQVIDIYSLPLSQGVEV
jgi:glycosyltransferase involved in cell wall biosynthesis